MQEGYIKYIQNEKRVMEEVCNKHPFLVGLEFVKIHVFCIITPFIGFSNQNVPLPRDEILQRRRLLQPADQPVNPFRKSHIVLCREFSSVD